ncbi:ATP-binding protein [Skermania piniformis]|uniref:AAA family ATPase n=1 Tax=Skermania pinensis TaxID=39122 RepID=A0ABX8SCQ7_9ACTN|nr:ATP-binding protein [Skermania piniformis]QXQ15081.1 AAA family ATPase [Skermania piniformis]
MPSDPSSQFHLDRLQVVNWGVFDGYHSIRFSPGGSLITGASGSGKSSLLDAISLGFLQNNQRNFNASSDTTAAGSRSGKRTVDKYVRGAWGERRDGAGRAVMYLRGVGPTWSAVAVTYRSTTDSVTGLVLKWFASGAMTDPESRFLLADGEHDIRDLCNDWAAGGYEHAVLTRAGFVGGRHEHKYLSSLYARIGIRGSDAAQQLLGKAKSLKSVGGLEQFVREYMLDEPQSLAQIAETLKQIDPLVAARTLLDVARRKRTALGDIAELQVRYAVESADLGIADTIDDAMVTAYVDRLRLARCAAEIADHDAEIDELGGRREEVAGRQQTLAAEHGELILRMNSVTADLAPLQARLATAETHLAAVAARRAGYDRAVAALDLPVPDNAAEFESTRAGIVEEAGRLRRHAEGRHEAITTASATAGRARERCDAVAADLHRVRTHRSPLPEAEQQMRAAIAAAIGIDPAQLRYVAELVELAPEQERWRVAVEKILRPAGLRLLVPDQHYRAALRHVDGQDMRGRIQLYRVEPGRRPRPAAPETLAATLRATDPTHDSAAEALDIVAAVADHVCVDHPDQFARHPRAVTDQGLRKDSARLAIKDDRAPLRRSAYIFTGDLDAKLTSLQDDLDEARAAAEAAERTADELWRSHSQDLDRAARYTRVADQFTRWDELDLDAAEDDRSRLADRLDDLLAANPDVDVLREQAQALWDQITDVLGRSGVLDARIGALDARRTRLLDLPETLTATSVPDTAIRLLDRHRAEVPVELDLLAPRPFRDGLLGAVRRERDQLRENRRRSKAQLSQILAGYDEQFPDAIPNDSDNLDERVHDYVELARRIDERELPEAHDRMLRLITEQAPEAIMRLHLHADQEAHRISDQVTRVNTGLSAVEFNRGTRLRLRADERRLAAVDEFRTIATRIFERAPAVTAGDDSAIFDQYADILRLRETIAGPTPEAKAWTRDALDVRNRFVFYCEESAADTGEVIKTYSNAGDNSGGEQEKLMAFCLAGALSFNLADPDRDDNRPVFAQLMLDEAFSKSDPTFARQSLTAFGKFGFQLIIVATVQNTTTIQPYVDSVVMVSKTAADTPGARPVASATTRTITEFAELRRSFAGAGPRQL